MGAAETVRDVVNLAATAGLRKDVIDLLQAKTTLLAEQVAALEKEKTALTAENTELLRENRNLKSENDNLKGQLEKARPKGDELDAIAVKMLVTLANFDNRHVDMTDTVLIQVAGLTRAKGEYFIDQLSKRKFIVCTGGSVNGFYFVVTPVGREYMARNGLL